MNSRSILYAFLITLLAITESSCRLAGGIFKAGFWSGIIVVVIVVVGVVFLATRARG